MRNKNPIKAEKKNTTFDVSNGLDFSIDVNDLAEESMTQPAPVPSVQRKKPSKKTVKSERKIQFSMTCTQLQKERFAEAAQKVSRTLPNFICIAVEEYIENHNL